MQFEETTVPRIEAIKFKRENYWIQPVLEEIEVHLLKTKEIELSREVEFFVRKSSSEAAMRAFWADPILASQECDAHS